MVQDGQQGGTCWCCSRRAGALLDGPCVLCAQGPRPGRSSRSGLCVPWGREGWCGEIVEGRAVWRVRCLGGIRQWAWVDVHLKQQRLKARATGGAVVSSVVCLSFRISGFRGLLEEPRMVKKLILFPLVFRPHWHSGSWVHGSSQCHHELLVC